MNKPQDHPHHKAPTSLASPVDALITGLDRTLRHLNGVKRSSHRATPVESETNSDSELSHAQKRLAIRLMRVNHAGEIAAQALYRGQASTTNSDEIRDAMEEAASEEIDHLAWCEQRLEELQGKVSILNPLWYVGSFALGYAAGKAGDEWSLGFVGETERQVEAHLDRHLEQLPVEDRRSRQIITAMKEDEVRHGQTAMDAGGRELPLLVRKMMSMTSKLMTKSSFWM